MRRSPVTRTVKMLCQASAVPAGDRHPFCFALHPVESLAGQRLVEAHAAMIVAAPDDLRQAVERPNDDEHVVTRRRHVAGIKSRSISGQVGHDNRARAAEPERGSREDYLFTL